MIEYMPTEAMHRMHPFVQLLDIARSPLSLVERDVNSNKLVVCIE